MSPNGAPKAVPRSQAGRAFLKSARFSRRPALRFDPGGYRVAVDAGGDVEDLAECQEADGDDDDGDAVEELGHAEGESCGAAGAVNADEGQGEADSEGRDAADH